MCKSMGTGRDPIKLCLQNKNMASLQALVFSNSCFKLNKRSQKELSFNQKHTGIWSRGDVDSPALCLTLHYGQCPVVSDSVILWTTASQAPVSMGFSRQEDWCELPLPIPGNNPNTLRNQYAGQEATDRTVHGTKDWLQIGKGVCQGYILSPC